MAAPVGLKVGSTGSGSPSGAAGGELSGTYPNPSIAAATKATFAGALTPTAVKTTTYAIAAGDFVPVDSTGGTVALTLPTAPADKTRVGVKKVDASANTVTITTGGSDVFNIAGGVTTATITLTSQGVILQYKSSSAIWYAQSTDLPLSGLDLRYQGIAAAAAGDLAGTYPNPTLSAATAAALSFGLPMASGSWYNPNGTNSTGTSGNNNRACFIPVQFAKACTLNAIAEDITIVSNAAGVDRFGIYTDVSGLPGTLVVDLGTVAVDALGVTTLGAFTQAVSARWYWVCVASQSQGTTRATRRAPGVAVGVGGHFAYTVAGGTNNANAFFSDTGYSGALPGSAGTMAGVLIAANAPAIWLKAA